MVWVWKALAGEISPHRTRTTNQNQAIIRRGSCDFLLLMKIRMISIWPVHKTHDELHLLMGYTLFIDDDDAAWRVGTRRDVDVFDGFLLSLCSNLSFISSSAEFWNPLISARVEGFLSHCDDSDCGLFQQSTMIQHGIINWHRIVNSMILYLLHGEPTNLQIVSILINWFFSSFYSLLNQVHRKW